MVAVPGEIESPPLALDETPVNAPPQPARRANAGNTALAKMRPSLGRNK
jgi:hypothetical protein